MPDIRIRVIGLSRDRRTEDLKQRDAWLTQAFTAARAQCPQEERDTRIEQLWRARVRDNVLGIYRARDEIPALARRQAS